MARKRFGPERVVAKLRQIEVLIGEGQSLQQALRKWLAMVGAGTLYSEPGSLRGERLSRELQRQAA